jgi:hypothetical protein
VIVKATRSQVEEKSLAKRVFDGIADWHYRHFGNVAWDKGVVFFLTLVATVAVTPPVWLGAACIDRVRLGCWPWSAM